MSEYQYYEFRCIDRPLTAEEQKEIGRWSSRTHPTSTGAGFIYNYGNFPKDEKRVVEQLDIEKNDFLVRLAKGEPLLSVRLLKRLKELSIKSIW